MPVVEDSIEIEAPRAEVFAAMDDPANVSLTNSSIIEYEQEGDGARGKGTRHRGVIKVAGRKIAFVDEITEYEPGEHLTLRSVEAPAKMSWSLEVRVEDAGEGRSRLVFHQDIGSLGGFFGRLSDGLVTKMYAKDVRANLENIKTLLEEG